jgi:hypothetical protein
VARPGISESISGALRSKRARVQRHSISARSRTTYRPPCRTTSGVWPINRPSSVTAAPEIIGPRFTQSPNLKHETPVAQFATQVNEIVTPLAWRLPSGQPVEPNNDEFARSPRREAGHHPRPMNERAWRSKIVASYKFTSVGSDAISTATFATSAASMTLILKNHRSAARRTSIEHGRHARPCAGHPRLQNLPHQRRGWPGRARP